MLLALVLQPSASQMAGEEVDRNTVYEAHGRGNRNYDSLPDCDRGRHRTSGGVTTSGDASCRFPGRAHVVLHYSSLRFNIYLLISTIGF